MEESLNTIVEHRKELMISPVSTKPISKDAHFLLPSVTCIDGPVAHHPFQFQYDLVPTFNPKEWPLKIKYTSWRGLNLKWNEWVTKMAALHAPTWRKAGIYDSVIGSTYTIKRNDEIVLGVAERWCPETKTFSFPWGEATITLEDVMVMMGYSVLGCSVLSPLESQDLEEINERLEEARKEISRTSAKKADDGLWMRKFMNSGDDLEHEAFLALWLSRYVLQPSQKVISKCQLPVAVNLARGIRVALAPAVLATIYRDLSVLKDGCLQKLKATDKYELHMNIPSPFQLVQVWVWERFPDLRPVPNYIQNGQPRLARWQNVNKAVQNVRLLLESAKESFVWRPYAKTISNWSLPKYYGETDMLLSADSLLGDEFISYVRCIRVSELVGLECEEQYLPNRVGLQFGMDQDLPGFVSRSDQSPEIGFDYYSRPIGDVKLYIPSRLQEGYFTSRYLNWWYQPVSCLQDGTAKMNERYLESQATPRTKQNTSYKCSVSLKILNQKRKYKDMQNSTEPTLQRSKISFGTSMELKDSTAESSRTKVSDSYSIGRTQQIDESVPAISKKESAFEIKVDLQDSPYPPGFSCRVVEAEKSVKKDLKDSTTESSRTKVSDSCSIDKRQIDEPVPAISKKESAFEIKIELQDSPYPPGFPCCVVESEKSVKTDLKDSTAESSMTKFSDSCSIDRRQMEELVPATSKKKSAFEIKKELQDSPYPPGFPCRVVESEKSVKTDLKGSAAESSMTKLSDSCSIDRRQMEELVAAISNKKSAFETKKELQDSPYPPGFPCRVVQAEKCIDEDHLTVSNALRIHKLQREVINSSDEEDSIDEDHLTLSNALQIHKLQKEAIYVSNDEDSTHQDHVTNDETLGMDKKKNVVINSEENDGEHKATNLYKVGSPATEEVGTSDIKKDKDDDDDGTEVISFGIEARLKSLEKVISDMVRIYKF